MTIRSWSPSRAARRSSRAGSPSSSRVRDRQVVGHAVGGARAAACSRSACWASWSLASRRAPARPAAAAAGRPRPARAGARMPARSRSRARAPVRPRASRRRRRGRGGSAARLHPRSQLRSPCHGRCDARPLRRARRRLRGQPAARPDRHASAARRARSGSSRAIAAQRVPQGREVRRRRLVRPVDQARAHRARARRHARVRAAVVRRAHPRARRERARRAITLSGPSRRACSTTSTRSAPAATGCRRSGRPARSSAAASSTGRSCPARRRRGRELVHPDLEPDAALAKLEEQLVHVLRLDEADPVAAWRGAHRHARRASPSA